MKKAALSALMLIVLCGLIFIAGPVSASTDDGFFIIPVTSMTFKGDWSADITYSQRDVVFYNGSSWFSLVGSNKGNVPDVLSSAWTLLAQKGDTGPAVHTSAVCVDAVGNSTAPFIGSDGLCSCSGRTISNVTTKSSCTATADTGNCTGHGAPKGGADFWSGSCCVCAP